MKSTERPAATSASPAAANDPARLEHLASQLAEKFSSTLLQIARTHPGEADFRREAARLFEEMAEQADIKLDVRDEFRIAKGRVDAVYNRLVIEYEHPGALRLERGKGGNPHAVQQVKDYILGVAKKHRREESRLAGVAMDGHYFIFVRRVGEGWIEDDPVPTNTASAAYFLRLLFSLSVGAALVPENLINDFGPKTLQAQRAVRAIYATLHSSKHPLVQKLFEQWRVFFAEATDYKEWVEQLKSKPEFQAFVASLWTKEEITYLDPAKVFFVLHTYYALLIKLVASLAAARFAGGSTTPLTKMAMQDDAALLESFRDLERGGLFRTYGIRNFLEGDFFGWYLAAWNDDMAESVRALVRRLSEYDPGSLELAPENARDLLKKLYHYLLPREIRHDLGEYYTPDWLAERLIRQMLTLGGGPNPGISPDTRVLDPACGSGTFLVLLIRFMRNAAERKDIKPAATLSAILKNVVGIDLNPLAVIAARTNYLLALGDLLKHRKGEIDIPVYQADSILTPAKGDGLFEGNRYVLKTSVGAFGIPDAFAKKERMDVLANILDESVESGVSTSAFLARIEKLRLLEPEELGTARDILAALFEELTKLHKQGLNGVWARIIKNAFAPVFLEPFQYVVGNPPWVNWNHLPDEYRRQTMSFWSYYGLLPRRQQGMETILGAASYDISMLMTYVSAHRYLKKKGKLGFVLSQSLFKSAAAGQGFRRFELPDSTAIRPIIVEDMVGLNPFEGAANRTVVAVFEKNGKSQYPVSYTVWKKREEGRKGSFEFDTPYSDVVSTKLVGRYWFAEPVDVKDKTSAWLTARKSAISALRNITGPSDYQARLGTHMGGANAVFWMDVNSKRPDGNLIVTNVIETAKRQVPRIQATVEPDLVFPLLRGLDVTHWRARSEISILICHESTQKLNAIPEEVMQARYPKTFSYLKRFESILRKRPSLSRYFKEGAPFYSIFNIGRYTFADWKVVWRYIAPTMMAAVVGPAEGGKPIIPDSKLVLCDVSSSAEANYLAAALNSSPSRLLVQSYSVSTQLSAHIMNNIRIPKFARSNRTHLLLAELSEAAHAAMAKGNASQVEKIEADIDHAVAHLWGLKDEELADIQRSLDEA